VNVLLGNGQLPRRNLREASWRRNREHTAPAYLGQLDALYLSSRVCHGQMFREARDL